MHTFASRKRGHLRCCVYIRHIVFWLTTKFLSYVWADFLNMANIGLGYRHVVVRQFLYQCGCLSFLPQVSLHWRSNLHQIVSLENSKLCFHSNLLRYMFPCTVEIQIWTFLLWVFPGLCDTVCDARFRIGFSGERCCAGFRHSRNWRARAVHLRCLSTCIGSGRGARCTVSVLEKVVLSRWCFVFVVGTEREKVTQKPARRWHGWPDDRPFSCAQRWRCNSCLSHKHAFRVRACEKTIVFVMHAEGVYSVYTHRQIVGTTFRQSETAC